ncbi:MAG: zinc-dependent metalloproteinase lipoprotein [Bacteroidales bacterium]
MKLRVLFALWLVIIFCGCKKLGTPFFEISQTEFNIAGDITTFTIDLQSNCDWIVSSDAQWCTPRRGLNSILLTLTFNNDVRRVANLTLSYNGVVKLLTIVQEKYVYNLPVVFHILYNNMANPNEYVMQGRIAKIIEGCNKYYRDMNIEVQLVAAKKDPQGNILKEPGVNRVKVENSVIDAIALMSGNSVTNRNLIWNVDAYVNVLVYTFSNNTLLGISHMPYTLDSNPLDGLSSLNFTPKYSNLKYPYCISLNNAYIYREKQDAKYKSLDSETTMAHELGHYIGLFHVFLDERDNFNSHKDSDYCADTPCYIRSEYVKAIKENFVGCNINEFLQRTDCYGNVFISDNIMDYEYGYLNTFTKNQHNRMRHVLNYSPLIPGPKIGRTKIDNFNNEPLDLPIRFIK